MGFALCASLDASYSHISVEEFDLTGKTFGLKAHVLARGDTPHSYYATEISCSTKLVARHIWLLHLSRDDWFATAQSGVFNQIEVVFESSRPGLFVRKCGLRLVYKQDVKMFTQTICSSNRITFEGCGGSHDEFDNLWRNCDDYNDKEPSAICSSSEAMESYISSDNGNDLIKHPYVTYMPNPILFYVLSSCSAGLFASKSVDSFIFFFFLLTTCKQLSNHPIFCVFLKINCRFCRMNSLQIV